MRLKPLEEWICDTCKKVISRPEQGQVEWLRDEEDKVHSFRICHNAVHSPIRISSSNDPALGPDCRTLGRIASVLDLKTMTGTSGMEWMISFLDAGIITVPDAESPLIVNEARNWKDTFRRLFFPYYEEARMSFEAAEAGGFFINKDDVSRYSKDALKSIIEKYGND